MKQKTTKADVGVIVARFQVHNLTSVHTDLLKDVISKHNKVLVFLGLSPLVGTQNSPLDFEARKQMILDSFPTVNVLYIKDVPDDVKWSNKLDQQIKDMLLPGQTAVLYGGRDSFISHYHGSFDTIEFEPVAYVSGTELRKEISSKVKGSSDFRAGVIWATHNRYPAVVATVDIIVYDERGRFLLVRKPDETLFRFCGGHAEPQSDSYEDDAKRELYEELGVEVSNMQIIGSTRIDDWRYRAETDKVKTTVFKAMYVFGTPTPADDVCEARWFSDLKELDLVPEHRVIFKKFIEGKKFA